MPASGPAWPWLQWCQPPWLVWLEWLVGRLRTHAWRAGWMCWCVDDCHWVRTAVDWLVQGEWVGAGLMVGVLLQQG
jgi:hypothetical protein